MAEGEHVRDEFSAFWTRLTSLTEGSEAMRLLKCMLSCYKKSVLAVLLTGSISTVVSMLLPIITKWIINYVESGDRSLA